VRSLLFSCFQSTQPFTVLSFAAFYLPVVLQTFVTPALLVVFLFHLSSSLTLNFLLAQRFWGVAKGRYINFLYNNNLDLLLFGCDQQTGFA